MLLVKNMLCSENHYQKRFDLRLFSYKHRRGGGPLPSEEGTA